MLPQFTSELATWVHPLSMAEFLREHWRKKPFVAHGSPERLGWLERVFGSFDVESMLSKGWGETGAWFVDDGALDTSVKVSFAIGAKLYRAGLTLHFHLRPDQIDDGNLLRELTGQLDESPASSKLSVFASRQGKKTLGHVDDRENITIQLTGHKRWRIGFDPLVMLRLEDWEPGMKSKSEDGQGMMPNDAETIDLLPGSILYVPANWVHATEDLADSVSLNVSFGRATWASVLGPTVLQFLVTNRSWGRPARGFFRPDGPTPEDLREIEERLSELASVRLPAWSLFEASAASGPDEVTLYSRNPLVDVWVQWLGKQPVLTVEQVSAPPRQLRVSDPQTVSACHWMCGRKEPFSLNDAQRVFPWVGPPLLGELVRIGFLSIAGVDTPG